MRFHSYRAKLKGDTIVWLDGTPTVFQDEREHNVLVIIAPTEISDPDAWLKDYEDKNEKEIIAMLETL